MHAIDASVDDDDEPPQTSDCKQRYDSTWSSTYAADEAKLLEALNKLRTDPTPLCSSPFVLAPLEVTPALRCAARMRARDENNYAKPGGGPDFSAMYFADQRSQEQNGVRDPEKRAGSTRIDAEIVFYNVSSVSGVIDVLEASPDVENFCWFAASVAFPFAGIGRYGNVWVIDLSRGLYAPTRPPTSGMGPGGPGNSGTAGR